MQVHDEVQRDGANARAEGLPKSANPYPHLHPFPSDIEETPELWKAKHDAWEIGWMMEDAFQGMESGND